jgi:RimJ/RimL family protein N-acetyltransferase
VNIAPTTLELEGARVRLEPLREPHASALLAAGSDPAVWTYLMERPRTLEQMRAWIGRALQAEAAGRELPFAIVEVATGQAIGSTRFEDLLPAHRSLEIGWTWLGVPWQRTVRNTQCKYLLLRHAFEVWGAVRVQLKADTRNRRSCEAIERIGAVYEGTLRKHRILPDGYVRDSAVYSVVRDEWPAVKQRLEELGRTPGRSPPTDASSAPP